MMQTLIQPWLSVYNGAKALSFYKVAFDAQVTYQMDPPDGSVVAKLSVNGAEFWMSGGTEENSTSKNLEPPVRMILITDQPEKLFGQALKAGATEIFPIGEEHGWKLGRIEDPFGHHWEIGHPLENK